MTSQKPAKPTSARHPTDYLSLIFGLIFLAAAGWWAASYYLGWVATVNLPDAGWVLAAGLILLGLIGIVASLRRDRPAAEPAPLDAGTVASPGAPPAPPAATGEPAGPGQPSVGDVTADLGLPRPGEQGEGSGLPPAGILGEDRPAAGDLGGHRPE